MLYLGIDQHAKQLTVSLRNPKGDVILRRQVSTEPKRCIAFFEQLKKKTEADGYICVVEVCGFNDWLLLALPEYGATDVVLIQPKKRPKVKTDRRDANSLSELLRINRDRIKAGQPSTWPKLFQEPTCLSWRWRWSFSPSVSARTS